MIEESKAQEAARKIEDVVQNVGGVIKGKDEQVRLVVLTILAKGHVLLEDVPGTGKTTLVRTIARSVDCGFSRIQFTPDLMPSDVMGFTMFNEKDREFEYRPGGIMSNLVLADEINRASAKTQSALLEAMEERQVTVDGVTHSLEEPFCVLATQNPIEQYGTYPLPEAQVDRFLVKLSLGFPEFDDEVKVVAGVEQAKQAVRPVASAADVLALREAAGSVNLAMGVIRYIVQLVRATRSHPELQSGASTRGCMALASLARAYALSQGRAYVTPDDVKAMAPHVLCHRISLTHEAKINGRTAQKVLDAIVSSVAVPTIDAADLAGLKGGE